MDAEPDIWFDVDTRAMRRAYRFQAGIWTIVGTLTVWYGVTGRSSDLLYLIAVIGGLVTVAGIVGLLRAGSTFLRADDNGISTQGLIRSHYTRWEDVDYLGWAVYPQLAFYAREAVIPVFKIAHHRMPVLVWVTSELMGRYSHDSAPEVARRWEEIATRRGIRYVDRIPRVNTYLYSYSAASVVIALVLGALLFDRRFH